jgi:hypothetical protein
MGVAEVVEVVGTLELTASGRVGEEIMGKGLTHRPPENQARPGVGPRQWAARADRL